MAMQDSIVNDLLNVPVGQIESFLKQKLEGKIQLEVVEQNRTSGTNFVRKIVITANSLPVIRATVSFDSSKLPEPILSDLLRKNEGIGSILTQNKITAQRKILSLESGSDGTVKRNYEIIDNSTVLFYVSEEILLANLLANKNSR
jgi:chorismate-pyruvate lyase